MNIEAISKQDGSDYVGVDLVIGILILLYNHGVQGNSTSMNEIIC
jgi:hypothetical protein